MFESVRQLSETPYREQGIYPRTATLDGSSNSLNPLAKDCPVHLNAIADKICPCPIQTISRASPVAWATILPPGHEAAVFITFSLISAIRASMRVETC